MTRGRGRPKKGFIGLDQEIVKYLLSRETGATWGEIKNEAAPGVVNSASLKKALDRLMDAGLIGALVEKREGRRAVLYVIKEPLLFTKIPGAHSSLLSWIEKAINYLEKQQGDEKDENSGARKININEAQRCLYEQGEAVSVAIRWLGVIILDAVIEANSKPDEEERRKYLNKFCCTYLNVLITEFVYLASGECGSQEWAYAVGLEALDANHLSSFMSGGWPPSENPDEKRGNEPA